MIKRQSYEHILNFCGREKLWLLSGVGGGGGCLVGGYTNVGGISKSLFLFYEHNPLKSNTFTGNYMPYLNLSNLIQD